MVNGSIIMECCMGGGPIHMVQSMTLIVMAYLPAGAGAGAGADFIFSM